MGNDLPGTVCRANFRGRFAAKARRNRAFCLANRVLGIASGELGVATRFSASQVGK